MLLTALEILLNFVIRLSLNFTFINHYFKHILQNIL